MMQRRVSLSFIGAGGDRIKRMSANVARVRPIGWRDMLAVTRMTFDNMIGVDRYFTRMVRNPLGRWFTYVSLPFYLRFSGRGYKIVVDDHLAACGFLHLRRHSGYIFNVSVSRPYRRRGLGRCLVTHLERVTERSGIGWAALQVDRGNGPAEQLYQQLGYRAYHPHFLRRDGRPPISRAATAGISLEPMAHRPGKMLYRRYQSVERQKGDYWAAAVVGEYDSFPEQRSLFWRCRLYQREIGCARVTERDARPLIRLALAPAYWGHLATGGVAKKLVDSLSNPVSYVDLFLESSAHHRAATPVLNGLGFQERCRSRTLMLKALGEDSLPAEPEDSQPGP
jgi:ribosomal protein S18 acetylase RimI-like enzyme